MHVEIRKRPMTEPQAAIQVSRLSKAFGSRIVLDAVDLKIGVGESVALCGANGVGKTTLLGCLASVLRPDGGEVSWYGRPAGCDVALRRRIGLLTHESGLYSHLTLRENLVFAARMGEMDNPRHSADRWLDMTGLTSHADVLPTRISRGMRQRLVIARALIHKPLLLLLDEPFTALDTAGAEWLSSLLIDLRDRGHTICFVTHEQDKIRRLAQRVVEFRGGKVYDISGCGKMTCGAGVSPAQTAGTAAPQNPDERHSLKHAA
jgi:ABC-type multidrug transport system ATPase subunit